MYQLLTVIALVYISSSAGQMCQNLGKECFTHSDCCGGCCMKRLCVASARNCLLAVDDCEEFYCPPGLSCALWQMPGCPGCPIVPFCKEESQQVAGEWG